MYYDVCKVVKNNQFVTTHQINGLIINIYRVDWTKEEKEKVQCCLKAKTIFTTAHSLDEFLHVSHYETIKEM